MEPLRVGDYADLAQSVLPADVWGYVQGGSGNEWTVAENRAAFDRLELRPRVLVDVTACDTSTTLLGSLLAAPIGVAPMAYHRLAHPDGEPASAAAAGSIGGPFVASIFASQPLAEIAKHADGPLWLQLYWLRRRDVLVDLVRQAEEAGYSALVLTVDAPKVARRLRDVRNSFSLPDTVAAVNVDSSVMTSAYHAGSGESAIERHSRERFDQSITWADLEWLRSLTTLPLVIKGIMTGEDALLAAEYGVDGVVVSNHGGRQLDGAPGAVAVLPEVVAAVGGRLPVMVDGGVRSGADVFRALALGAAAVFVGRPVLWGLAVDGADGATSVLRMIRDELVECMVLAGRPSVDCLDRSAVRLRPCR
ncbi:MAG TPA: alpha-hydroxy acid oxidase [Pseudonocardiaceae bacterium]